MCLVLSKGLKKNPIYQHLELHQLDFKLRATQSPLKKIHFANYYYYNNYLFLKGVRI